LQLAHVERREIGIQRTGLDFAADQTIQLSGLQLGQQRRGSNPPRRSIVSSATAALWWA